MGRPRKYDEKRINTHLRIPESLYEKLEKEAAARELSINWLINRAIEEFLPRLIPPEEWRWTRGDNSAST